MLRKSTPIKFKVATYTITGKSFLCPDNTTKEGDLVIAFEPLQRVDPMNKFAFVIDTIGETQSVSRKFLKKETILELWYDKPGLSTAHEEKKLQLQSMREYIAALAPTK